MSHCLMSNKLLIPSQLDQMRPHFMGHTMASGTAARRLEAVRWPGSLYMKLSYRYYPYIIIIQLNSVQK